MESWICYPRWNGTFQNGFDIALAKLNEPLVQSSYPTLSRGTFEHNSKAYALGWDLHRKSDRPVMVKPGLVIVDNSVCESQLKQNIQRHMVCMFSEDDDAVVKGRILQSQRSRRPRSIPVSKGGRDVGGQGPWHRRGNRGPLDATDSANDLLST